MKLINESLAGKTVSTSLCQFTVEQDGTFEVADEVGAILLQREGYASFGPLPEPEMEEVGEIKDGNEEIPKGTKVLAPKQNNQPRFKRNK